MYPTAPIEITTTNINKIIEVSFEVSLDVTEMSLAKLFFSPSSIHSFTKLVESATTNIV